MGILIFPSSIFAGFTFTTSQTTINLNQEIDTSVILSLQGQNNKTYYLEGAFKKENSSSYFGLTWNDASWVPYTASNFLTLKSITTDQSGNWSGIVKVKLDQDSNLFSGSGMYTLRLKRFTIGGSNSWADNSVAITVNSLPPSISTPSPTNNPTPTPTPLSSFTITNTPSQINSDQQFNITVNLSLPSNPNTVFYLKGAFKKPDGSNYFGETLVSGSFVKNSSSFTNQHQITTDSSGNWSGTLETKPDDSDSGFTGTGDYVFKVGRYTASGSGPTWSNESTIKIISVENQPEETITASSPATSPASSPSTKTKGTSSMQARSSGKLTYRIASVAAATTAASPLNKETKVDIKSQKQTNPAFWAGLILIIAGVSSIGYIYYKNGKIRI